MFGCHSSTYAAKFRREENQQDSFPSYLIHPWKSRNTEYLL